MVFFGLFVALERAFEPLTLAGVFWGAVGVGFGSWQVVGTTFNHSGVRRAIAVSLLKRGLSSMVHIVAFSFLFFAGGLFWHTLICLAITGQSVLLEMAVGQAPC